MILICVIDKIIYFGYDSNDLNSEAIVFQPIASLYKSIV